MTFSKVNCSFMDTLRDPGGPRLARRGSWRGRTSPYSNMGRKKRPPPIKTETLRPISFLKSAIRFWSMLVEQDTSPLRPDIQIESSDSSDKLISELSRLLPDIGSQEAPEVSLPSDTRGSAAEGSSLSGSAPIHPKPEEIPNVDPLRAPEPSWTKQRSVLQNELARLKIWKSNFSERDMTLLLSKPSPLFRTILETVVGLAETLISRKTAFAISLIARG